MKTLVTGSAGFLGRHFTKFFKDLGHDVTECDVKDGYDCRDLFKNDTTQYDLVIHCAAVIGGRDGIENNAVGIGINFALDSEMFHWALKTKPGKVVYFSSSAAYPIVEQQCENKLDEKYINLKHIRQPDSLYGMTKVVGELLAQGARQAGLNVLVVRPFTGYGSDQDLDYPFPSFIQRAKRKDDPFFIWGNGSQTRDFIYVDDIVESIWTLLNKETLPPPINLCTGRATSFDQLADMCCEAVGYKPEKAYLLNKPMGVWYRVGDERQMKLLDLNPKITLEEGIKRALSI